jgi:multicomponent K+:H+ antiporter subunit G
MLELLASLFLTAGGAFALIGSIGLARLPDLFMRLHGPTKATTLGVGGILVASMLHFSSIEAGLSLHELLVALFLMITAPVSAHLIARTMIHLGGGERPIPDVISDARYRNGAKNGKKPERQKA